MSAIFCIGIAALADRWKATLIAAVLVGLPLTALSGALRWEDTSPHGSVSFGAFMFQFIAIGAAAFLVETAAFFAVKLGFRAMIAKAKASKKSVPS